MIHVSILHVVKSSIHRSLKFILHPVGGIMLTLPFLQCHTYIYYYTRTQKRKINGNMYGNVTPYVFILFCCYRCCFIVDFP